MNSSHTSIRPPISITSALGYSVHIVQYQLTLVHSALLLLLLTLHETNEQSHELGVEEQLLDTGQESGLVQAQVVPSDLEAGPLVVPSKLEAGQLLVPGVGGWYSGRPRGARGWAWGC
jgi:hypothetical protein